MTRQVKGLVIPVEGPSEVMSIEENPAALSKVVGGWLEGATLESCHFYCDEEGKLKDLPVNVRATLLAIALDWGRGDTLRGTVVFLGNGRNQTEADAPQEVLDLYQGVCVAAGRAL